jgi:hypothetical protein
MQLINPNIKCCLLFVIESPSGIGNERIQAQIDEILALIQLLIPRRFIATDGDSSYYQRHKTHGLLGAHFSSIRLGPHTGRIETVFPCYATQRFAPLGGKLQNSVLEI